MAEEEKEKRLESKKLFDAVEKGLEATVKILLENKNQKLDINFKFEPFGRTALHKAVNRGFKNLVKILIEHGAALELPDAEGWAALHFAAAKEFLRKDFEEIVKILLGHGSNVHLQTNQGVTALHIAAFRGSEGIVKILLEHGANIDLQDNKGRTVFDVARDERIVELIKTFQERNGANIKPAKKE